MNPKYAVLLKISGVYGVLAPVLAFTFILAAVSSYPPFSWTNNALSDLGVVPGVTAGVFNSGLIICGVLCLMFAMGLYVLLTESVVGRVGVFVFGLACVALAAIGTFPENVSPTHYLVSVAFFVLLPISLLIIVGGFWRTGQVQMAAFTLAVAVVAALPWILYFSVHYVPGVAIPEAVSGLAGAVWAVALGYKMMSVASQSKTA
ncbi:MAG: DUF998 domain-containing protein [Candidatus Bathyarchaeota archaeon]|nr:DUF998 domain-containing protein [Candidatus Bathyarchaeota archaeon]